MTTSQAFTSLATSRAFLARMHATSAAWLTWDAAVTKCNDHRSACHEAATGRLVNVVDGRLERSDLRAYSIALCLVGRIGLVYKKP